MPQEELSLKDNPIWIFWKKYGEHFTAPLILIALVILAFQLHDNNLLKKQINKNCGWGEQDYECYCEKSEAIRIKNLLKGNFEINYTYNIADVGIENASRNIRNYYKSQSDNNIDKIFKEMNNDSLGN